MNHGFVFGVISKDSLPITWFWRFFFSSKVLHWHIFRLDLTILILCKVWDLGWGLCVLCIVYNHFAKPFFEKTIFSLKFWSLELSFHLCQKSVDHICEGLFLDSILFHWSRHYPFVSPHYLHYYSFKITWWDFSNFILLFQNCLGYFSSFATPCLF